MQFDLKYATITMKDGYTGPAGTPLVNNAAGYTTGATTMTIDGVTGAFAVGDLFKMTGDTTVYKITAHTETLTATTSITFTPGLVIAVTDNEVIIPQPHQLDIKIGQGTLTFNETRKMEYVLDRGRLDTVREGDQEPVDVRLDFIWEHLRAVSGTGVPTVEDILKNRGEAAGWITSSPDACEPYAIDIVITFAPPCTGENKDIITLPVFRWESLNHDAKAGTIACSGKCNVTQATVVRAA